MPTIAVVDDDSAKRTTVKKNIDLELNETWTCFATAPLPAVKDYLAWIADKEVAVLLIDEKLSDRGGRGKSFIDYQGHEVIQALRKKVPNLPIFVITSDPAGMDPYGSAVEAVFTHADLSKHRVLYTTRMVRAGERFTEGRRKELGRLTELAALVALGSASADHLKELGALQAMLGLEYVSSEAATESSELSSIETKLTGLEASVHELKEMIRASK